MADYRDPKVTSTGDKSRGMGTWIGVILAAIVVVGLIWWWSGGDYDQAAVVQPVEESTAPAAEGEMVAPDTEVEVTPVEPTAPATEGTTTAPAQ